MINDLENQKFPSTEERNLRAAEKEFLEKGYAGARTASIASAAGVTHIMLHYYFRTKERLFEQIVEEKVKLLRGLMLTPLLNPAIPLLEKVRTAVETHLDFLAANPELPGFMISVLSGNPEFEAFFQEKVKDINIVDASNPNMAKTSVAYIQGVIGDYGTSPVITRTLYNPQLKSSYNFVPGIMGMIFILVCAIMTSVSIVREKESGTMNLLLVSPLRPATVIIGKLIPYFILSCVILAIMLSMSYGVLGIPLSGSAFDVVRLTLLYIILALSIGLLVSTIVETQLAPLIVSAVIFMMPVIFLSGMLFPIDNMPGVLHRISCKIPARWYIAALRKLMIQQLDFGHIVKDTARLASMALVIISVSIKKFNSKN